MGSRVLKSGLVLAGVLVGVGVTTLFGNSASSPEAPLPDTPRPQESPFDSEAAAMRRRLEALERQQAQRSDLQPDANAVLPVATSPDKVAPPAPDYSPGGQAAGLAEAYRLYDESLVEFDKQPSDPTWAPQMATQVQNSISRAIEGGHLHATAMVECRSSMCIAKVTWPDFKTAQKEYLMADAAEQGCARHLMLSEPSDPGAAYTARLVLNCSREAQNR